jgi:hypothetical protein
MYSRIYNDVDVFGPSTGVRYLMPIYIFINELLC